MEVHRQLGHGFKEVSYKDALEIEFELNNIPFTREKMFDVEYKGILLPENTGLILWFSIPSSSK